MASKLNKRKCKNCKKEFQKKQPLQYVCSTACAIEYSKTQQDRKQKQELKKIRAKNKALKVHTHTNVYRKQLQLEINKLSRKIDEKFGYHCIDCGKRFGKQVDASHFKDVGGNNNVRYNLHNVHAARAHCNRWMSGRKKEYKEGLVKRYSEEYADYVDYTMSRDYPMVKLSNEEVVDKLKIVRKINREFDSYDLKSSLEARDLFNTEIGIYDIPFVN